MHGQDRSEYKARLRDEATAKKLAQKAQQWNLVSAELLKRRRDAKEAVETAEVRDGVGIVVGVSVSDTLETLRLTEKMLTINPDPAYLWNHRMELLLSLTIPEESEAEMTPEAFIEKERRMTTSCLQRNPKAYGAWFHRKWAVRHWMEMMGYPNEVCTKLLEIELEQCADFLNLDERNFHCWSYRRFVVAAIASSVLTPVPPSGNDEGDGWVGKTDELDGSWTSWCNTTDDHFHYGTLVGPQIKPERKRPHPATTTTPSTSTRSQQVHAILLREWNFTTDKIRQNFSNGSAFHHRSKILPLLHPHASCTTNPDIVQQELELVDNAIYTEPDDQTSWWYLRFVVVWAGRKGADMTEEEGESYRSMLREQFECVRELVEAEDGSCKWGLLGMNTIATILFEGKGGGEEEGYDWKEEACGCLEALVLLDPDRVVRYRDMMERYN